VTVFGRYGLRTRQASNLVVRLLSRERGGAPRRKARGGTGSVPLCFFASLVSAGQKPAEKRADSLVAATPSGGVGERSDGEVSKSNLPPRRAYDSVLAPCSFWVLFPSRGGVISKGLGRRNLGERSPKPLAPPTTTAGARATTRRGTRRSSSSRRGRRSFACLARPMSLEEPKSAMAHGVRAPMLSSGHDSHLRRCTPPNRSARVSCPERR